MEPQPTATTDATADAPDARDAPAVRHAHLLGICGTGMTALAGLLQQRGIAVTGSDEHVYPPMSDHLASLAIPVTEGYAPENIPAGADLIVVGNVIREANPEAAEMRRRGLPFVSMAEAVRRFAIGSRRSIVVAGTHGKTTITALAAHTLRELGADPGFLIGGIARNFGSNFHLGGGDRFVIEGDEYDTAYFDKTPKFFKYNPHTLLFTSLEFDHGDIYPDLEAIRLQFARLMELLPPGGLLVAHGDDPQVAALLPRARCPVVTYGLGERNECRLSGVRVDAEGTAFRTAWRGEANSWHIPLAGGYNALNAAAVAVLAQSLGYAPDAVQAAFATFQGVKRRQEIRGEANGVTVIDDFAHHPTAVRLTVEAVCQRFPGRRLWAVFEPRSFTARSDRFQAEFGEAFGGAHRVLLAPAFRSDYSAGTAPLDTAAVAAAIAGGGIPAEACTGTDAILHALARETEPGDVVLVMSNGGFDNLHDRLLAALAERQPEPHP
ncbi:MAG: Mur ligase family protein [SAR324 cluster bacterium]|nr:Mur ligase family protein [SAR324 cluster bacterium]